MSTADKTTVLDGARREIYEYVQREGRTSESDLRSALDFDETALGHHLTVLRRHGYLWRSDDEIAVGFGEVPAERHETDEIGYEVRLARAPDRDGLIATIRAVADAGRYIEAESVADVLEEEGAVLRRSPIRSRLVFVARTDGDGVAGWVHLDLPELEKLRHTAVLTVGVHPEWRGHGIGSTLLERGERWAREHGYERLYNSVPATNETAVDWLADRGWHEEAVREGHYRIDGEPVDEMMMATDL
ncbi:MAG: GNAT family N-acetyltransferase [Haloferacaceae archaeon]|jgi:ribosomal protein S18 acetylase RimI-like enzyme